MRGTLAFAPPREKHFGAVFFESGLAQVDRTVKQILDRINKMGKINQQVSIRARFGQILLILSKTSSVDGNDAFATGVFFF